MPKRLLVSGHGAATSAIADIVERHGLRVTALELTVVEAAVRRGGGARLMDSALQHRVELDQLWRAHLRNKGRYGLTRGAPAAASRCRMEHVQRQNDCWSNSADKQNHRLADQLCPWPATRSTSAFPRQKVAIEVDGLAFHSDQDAFQHDRERQNSIALAGWQVLRFTWLDLTEYPERMLAEIRFAISHSAR